MVTETTYKLARKYPPTHMIIILIELNKQKK